MFITTTGIAFTISSLGLAFCGIRFFRAFQSINITHSENKTGLLLTIYFLGMSIQHAMLALSGLLFSNNSEAAYALLVVSNVVLAVTAPLVAYLFLYTFLPSWNPWLIMAVIFAFGLYVASITFISHPLPRITTNGGLDLNMLPSLQILLNIVLILIFLPIFIIFYKGLSIARSKKERAVFFVLAIVHFAGIINVTILFSSWLTTSVNLKNIIFDIGLIFIGLLFVYVFLIVPLLEKKS